MLDKIEKYIVLNDEKIYISQNSSGMWKCDKLPCNDIDDVRSKGAEMNKVLNELNTPKKEKKTPIPPKKEKTPQVKGIE